MDCLDCLKITSSCSSRIQFANPGPHRFARPGKEGVVFLLSSASEPLLPHAEPGARIRLFRNGRRRPAHELVPRVVVRSVLVMWPGHRFDHRSRARKLYVEGCHLSVKHLYDNKTRPHDLAHLEKPHGSWRSDPTSLPPRPGSDQWICMGRRIQRHIKHGQTMANDDASAHSATAAPLNPGKSGASGAGASQATLRGI